MQQNYSNCRRCKKLLEKDEKSDKNLGLCKSCKEKYQQDLNKFKNQFFGSDKIKDGFTKILEGLHEEYGLDTSDPNFISTPERCARAYAEIFSGLQDTDNQVSSIINSQFPSDSDEIVMSKNIRTFSMCPHHFLPVDYKIDVGYLPDKSVIGISKLTRMVEILAKRPVLQEQLTNEISDNLMKIDGCRGSACIVHGYHYCMIMRGVRQPEAPTITSSVRGVFRDDPGIKQEFQQCSLSSRNI